MELKSLTPNLMVENVNETIEFYTKTLNFELLQTVPEKGVLDWGFVKKEDVFIMFQQKSSIQEEYPQLKGMNAGGALTLYIRVEDLLEWYAKIKDQVNLIKTLHKTFYGANEFAIQDPNGFIITFSDILE